MSDIRTVGVEEEFLLVDASGTVSPIAEQLFRAADVRTPDGEPVAVAELKREQAEIGSVPCSGLADLRANLVGRRRRAADAAARVGGSVAAVATSPLAVQPTTSADERYEKMTAQFGLFARHQLTCGTHVHVSIGSRTEGVAVIDRIRPWLSVLTALSANSPFWNGEDSGYASYRTVVWGQWPTAGPVEEFGDEKGYDAAVAALLDSNTILDAGMIYFDARLSAHFPTVEIRVADACTEIDNSVAIAGLCRALVDTAAAQWRAGKPSVPVRVSLLRAAAWRAAKSGMAGELVDARHASALPAWTLVDEMLTHVESALVANGDQEYVAKCLRRLRESGTGADRQRCALVERGNLDGVIADVISRTAAR